MIIYKTTNTVNGKIYVGKDFDNDPSYLGSGVLLEMAIKKYGRQNFTKSLIESCSTAEELNRREIHWIRVLNSTDRKIGYNIALGGTGGDTTTNLSTIKKEEMLKKRSIALKKVFSSPAYRKKRSEITKRMWTPAYTDKMRDKMTGRKITWDTKLSKNRNKKGIVSESHREKIRISSTGRECVKVDDATQSLILSMYKECGPKLMSVKLAEVGTNVSPYVIRRILKKAGVYQKWRKKRPELFD